jgi:hypothetical protein
MITGDQLLIISELSQVTPLSYIKVEVHEGGWYYVYAWTGCQLAVGLGDTLPNALKALAHTLYKQFGADV